MGGLYLPTGKVCSVGNSVGNVGDANGVPPVPTCAPLNLGSWELSFGRRAPYSLLPTHLPSPKLRLQLNLNLNNTFAVGGRFRMFRFRGGEVGQA